MKVIFSQDFYQAYTSDPAASYGRMESIIATIESKAEIIEAKAASVMDIERVHTPGHIKRVSALDLYPISALAAGGAVQAATLGLSEPCFGLIRPPGHHASADSSWGFCYFNNMAVALAKLEAEGAIQSAHVLDFDLHFGDGTVNILGDRPWVTIHNPRARSREDYLEEVEQTLESHPADIIGISAGFDHHIADWGGLLATEDYYEMGRLVRSAARKNNGGCFGILEGGYNHNVLGQNVLALLNGLSEG